MPPQAAVKAGARDLRVQKLPQRAIEGTIGSSPMASASRSSSDTSNAVRRTTATASCAGVSPRRGNDPLARFLLRLDLQLVRRVAAIIHAIPVPPFVDGLLGRAEPFRQNQRRLGAGLDRSPNFRGRRRLLVKMDQHGRTPFRISLRTDLPIKKRRATRVYVIFRDGTATCENTSANAIADPLYGRRCPKLRERGTRFVTGPSAAPLICSKPSRLRCHTV